MGNLSVFNWPNNYESTVLQLKIQTVLFPQWTVYVQRFYIVPLLWKSPLSPQSTSLFFSLSLPVSYLFLVMWPFPSSFCLLHHCVCLPISQSLRGGCVTGSLSDHSGSELFQSGWDTCWDLPASCLALSLSLSASCSWSCCLTHASWIHSHAQTQKSRDSLRHTGSGSILNHNQIRFKISSLLLWHAADRVDKVEFELSFSDLFSSRSLFPPVDWRWTCVRQGVRETEEEGSGWSLHSY